MRRGFTLITLTTVLLAQAISATPQTRRAAFNPDGAFFLIGKPPDDFSDFSGIYLNGRKVRWLPTQALRLNNNRTFHYKTLNVKQDDFRFTTLTVGGVYFTFVGKFLRGGVFAELDLNDEQPVLEGVLTKYKNGNKVAEAKLKFSYFGGT